MQKEVRMAMSKSTQSRVVVITKNMHSYTHAQQLYEDIVMCEIVILPKYVKYACKYVWCSLVGMSVLEEVGSNQAR